MNATASIPAPPRKRPPSKMSSGAITRLDVWSVRPAFVNRSTFERWTGAAHHSRRGCLEAASAEVLEVAISGLCGGGEGLYPLKWSEFTSVLQGRFRGCDLGAGREKSRIVWRRHKKAGSRLKRRRRSVVQPRAWSSSTPHVGLWSRKRSWSPPSPRFACPPRSVNSTQY